VVDWDGFCPPGESSSYEELIPIEECDGICLNEEGEEIFVGDCSACEEDILGSDDEYYTCTTRRYTLNDTPEKIVMLSPDADLLWAGALIQGKSHRDGLGSLDGLTIDPVYRAPIKLVIPEVIVEGGNSRTVYNPSLLAVENALNEIILGATLDDVQDRGDVQFRMQEYHSEEAFALSARLSCRYMGFRASVGTEIETEANETTVAMTVWEKMYTVVIAPPPSGKPETFFTEDFTSDILEELIAEGIIDKDNNVPMYLSSIVYGRMMMFTLTSTSSYHDIDLALKASRKSIVSGTVEVNEEQKKLLESATLAVTSIGGPKEAAEAAIRSGDWRDFFAVEAQLSTAAPLIYTFKTLSDSPKVATVLESTTYNIRECLTKPPVEILEDFEIGSGDWTAFGGDIEWIDGDKKNYIICSGCTDPYDQNRGNFIHWIDNKSAHYAYYLAPHSIPDQLSVGYYGGTLEYYILHDRTVSTADYKGGLIDLPEVKLEGYDGKVLYFLAIQSCNLGPINFCKYQSWQKLSIDLSNYGYQYPNCWFEYDTGTCAKEQEIMDLLDNAWRLQIRAEYWIGGDTGFLDDVRITPPMSP
jgi:hypothetical protein